MTKRMQTADYLWATVYATGSASVSLTSGNTTSTFAVYSGITKLRMTSQPGPISGSLSREGVSKVQVDPGSAFAYTTSPSSYNYNAFVVASIGDGSD
jgi:glucan endo-1,3-alpha-glucosidase